MCTITPETCPKCGGWCTLPDGEDLESYNIIWKPDEEQRNIVREEYDISSDIMEKIRSSSPSEKVANLR